MCPCDPSREYVCDSCARWIEAKNAVNTLRVHLQDYAAARQIKLNIGEALR